MRSATEDAELGGRLIREGDWLMLSYLSANNDESVFDKPERFRVDRDGFPHIAFGVGAHACLGPHLARLEMRIPLDELIPGSTLWSSPANRNAPPPRGRRPQDAPSAIVLR
ncbi:cytochrome P450 [Bradyrhizobium sp. 18BD]